MVFIEKFIFAVDSKRMPNFQASLQKNSIIAFFRLHLPVKASSVNFLGTATILLLQLDKLLNISNLKQKSNINFAKTLNEILYF